MAIQPSFDEPLPYTYARTRAETAIFERDPSRDQAVREIGKLKKRAGMAVVGSWNATLPNGAEERLALLTNGKFARAQDLEAQPPNDFQGAVLDKDTALPLAFIVKRGVRSWKLEGSEAKKGGLLDYHARLALTGRFRTLEGEKYWATTDGNWIRHKDATVLFAAQQIPDFVKDGVKRVDVSIITGTLIAYEGKRAILATLASVARPLEADPALAATAGGGEVVLHRYLLETAPATSGALATRHVRGERQARHPGRSEPARVRRELRALRPALGDGALLGGGSSSARTGTIASASSTEPARSSSRPRTRSASSRGPRRRFRAASTRILPRKASEGTTYVVIR